MSLIDNAPPHDWDKMRRANPYKKERALDKQVGGDHYKSLAIQPIEYVTKNNMGYCEANIVKYITRHASKGGRQDIEKVIHYAELLLEMKYND